MSRTAEATASTTPMAARPVEDLPGHWLLARLGKRVLRPGGRKLTEKLLDDAQIPGSDVVELAPGLGRTAKLVMGRGPRAYFGIESDPAAVDLTRGALGESGTVVEADATATTLEGDSADVVIGEAMLTMQGERAKREIVAEAHRVLRTGGRYVIHEMALEPDTLADADKTEIRKALARAIKVNARPLTTDEWSTLFEDAGFEVTVVNHAAMALLRPHRMIADEGLARTLRLVLNVARNPGARKRILGMRRVFNHYSDNLAAIELVARKK